MKKIPDIVIGAILGGIAGFIFYFFINSVIEHYRIRLDYLQSPFIGGLTGSFIFSLWFIYKKRWSFVLGSLIGGSVIACALSLAVIWTILIVDCSTGGDCI